MKVLWITNIAIPQIANDLGDPSVPVGGWMVKLSEELSVLSGLSLEIAFPYRKNVIGKVNSINYCGFLESDLVFIKKTIEEYAPDIVHIHGTEGRHSHIVTRICEELGIINRVVVSIQGVMSIYWEHYTAYLPERVINGRTLRDCIKGNVKRQQSQYRKAGMLEIDTLNRVKHVIGRTDWDYAVTKHINSSLNYHFCNEMLRNSFYTHRWNIDEIEQYSIFCSQATSPIKGLHLAIEALSIIKQEYPSVKMYVAGRSYATKPKYMLSYYEKYILDLIDRLKLRSNIEFTGFLNEEEMCKRYLKSNVFVSASSIENSPNSVCEAMILGVPVVSSMVGGVANLLEHEVDGFYYQAEAPYMLAYYVMKVFESNELAKKFSIASQIKAEARHNVKAIVRDLIDIYSEIAE